MQGEQGPRDEERDQIVGEEEKVLARVTRTLEARGRTGRTGQLIDYDAELLALRDQIRNARLEDIPPLVEEMERLQAVAYRRSKVTESLVDRHSPYFGRLVIEEDDRRREVLIGRGTYLDSKTGVRIVDWRDAPVSRIYYRYEEGDDFDEVFGDREVEGEVLVRRSLQIGQARLKRIGTPQGTFLRRHDGSWKRAGDSQTKLSGGQGAAMRPESHHRPGRLGTRTADEREDKGLSEITALIDRRQFELITKPTSGLVVIQGGAGSGKTTIGLHRLAYLAFQDRRRFRGDKMLVVVFNDALVRYISRVLPALGVSNVPVTTYERWATRLRKAHVKHLPKHYAEDTPSVVTRLKKHSVMVRIIDDYAQELSQGVEDAIQDCAKQLEGGGRALRLWRSTKGEATAVRLRALEGWMKSKDGGQQLTLESRHAIERATSRARAKVEDIVEAWSEVLTDKGRLERAFAKHAPDAFSERELEWAHAYCARKVPEAVDWRDARLEAIADGEAEKGRPARGVDGQSESAEASLDLEDDAIVLRLYQRLRGPLRTKKGAPIKYEHVFVDETQDISPLELAVVLDTVSDAKSVTLAGDVAQKLYMDNGFTSWSEVLGELGLETVAVEPLKLSYRSTRQILGFATDVLGPLRNQITGKATRDGAPVELFRYTTAGEAVAFLSEALRDLVRFEPLASVAVITRYPEQADLYYKGLKHGEVPNLRRIADQDFPFRAGVDVTDVRQVKGLEFDYVVLVEATTAAFPEDDEARHLMHIAATRAAHQLWVVATGSPSMLIPEELRKNA